MSSSAVPLLETRALTCRFGGVVAVSSVSLTVHPNEIHCIIGPNGAGKSTLFNLITGFAPVTRGDVLFRGARITRLPPAVIARRGIVRTFQIPSLFPGLTVAEHIRLAAQQRIEAGGPLAMIASRRVGLCDEVEQVCTDTRLTDQMHLLGSQLSLGDKKRLEMAMALGTRPSLLLLDEPTAGMTVGESHQMAGTIQRLAEKVTLLVVEHDMDVVRAIADRVTVLHRGAVLASGQIEDIESDERVRAIYLGDALRE